MPFIKSWSEVETAINGRNDYAGGGVGGKEQRGHWHLPNLIYILTYEEGATVTGWEGAVISFILAT